MFAGAQSAFSKVWTGAKRFAPFPAAERQPIGLPGKRTGNGIIGPQLFWLSGFENHFFRARSFFSFAQRLLDQFFITETFQRNALGWGRSEAKRHLVFEDQGEGSSDVSARRIANAAFKPQVIALVGGALDRHNGGLEAISSTS